MTYSFNLVDQPWVPAMDANGQAIELSLRETLQQSDCLRELGGETPLVTAALYRLLLAVLQRVIPISNVPDEWQPLWEPGAWPDAALDAYLTQWRHRFDLFDAERPFYQRAHPEANTPKSIISLLYEFASGNNATLFDHHSEERGVTLSPAAAARALVTAQTFGLGGLSPISKQVFTDGPAARGITFLVQGDNLRQTLALNLLPYPVEYFVSDAARDIPAWESADPFQPLERVPFGYLDYLTWQARRVRLLPEDGPDGPVVREMLLGPGLRFNGETLDPLKHYRQSKSSGLLTLRFSEERALWRDSAALLDYQSQEARSPQVLQWLHQVIDSEAPGLRRSQTKRLLALGMANDKAKVEFYRQEQFPLPLAYLDNSDLVSHLQQTLALAEQARNQLWGALATLAQELLFHKQEQRLGQQASKQVDALIRSWGVEPHYWAALELPFFDLLQDLPQDAQPARAAWAAVVRRAAWQALNDAIAASGDDPLALKAAVLARGKLGGGLRKVLKDWPRVRKSPEEVTHVR